MNESFMPIEARIYPITNRLGWILIVLTSESRITAHSVSVAEESFKLPTSAEPILCPNIHVQEVFLDDARAFVYYLPLSHF
ncbi:hypothetical protein GJAV_G00217860 [Gymnothorax javanicus]|nr:hypothetical protein GJAV_G00217860 [Gymnothorax javanicus]